MTPKEQADRAVQEIRKTVADGVRQHIKAQKLTSLEAAKRVGALPGAVSAVMRGNDRYATLDDLLTWLYTLQEGR